MTVIFRRDRRNSCRVVLNVGHHLLMFKIILLHGVIGAERKQCCCWTITGKSSDILDRGYWLVGNVFSANIPGPCLSARKSSDQYNGTYKLLRHQYWVDGLL